MTNSVNFDRAAEFYDATRGFAPGQAEAVAAFITEAGAFTPATRVLEIGVGTGRIAVPLAAHTGPYIGIDISTGMMGKLREKTGGERVRLSQADAHRLPFAAGSFDAAVIVHVFHLVADPAQVARELARVITPDGLALHCRGGYGDGLNAVRAAWEQATHQQRPRDARWQQADTLLSDAGWHEISTHTHTYPTTTSPRHFLDRVEQRSWSSTWEMSDEALAQGVAAIRQAIDMHFNGDPDTVIPAEARFHVSAYRLAR